MGGGGGRRPSERGDAPRPGGPLVPPARGLVRPLRAPRGPPRLRGRRPRGETRRRRPRPGSATPGSTAAFLARHAAALGDRIDREARDTLAAELENVGAAWSRARGGGRSGLPLGRARPARLGAPDVGELGRGGEACRRGREGRGWRGGVLLEGRVPPPPRKLRGGGGGPPGGASRPSGRTREPPEPRRSFTRGTRRSSGGDSTRPTLPWRSPSPFRGSSGAGASWRRRSGASDAPSSTKGGTRTRGSSSRRASQAALALGSQAQIVFAKNQLGLVDYFAGDLDEAGRRLGEALALARAEGSRPAVAAALQGLGFVAEDRGDLDAATGFYAEGLAASRENGDRYGAARGLMLLGEVERKTGGLRGRASLLRGGARPGPGRREHLRRGPPRGEPRLPRGVLRPDPGGGRPRPGRPRRLSRDRLLDGRAPRPGGDGRGRGGRRRRWRGRWSSSDTSSGTRGTGRTTVWRSRGCCPGFGGNSPRSTWSQASRPAAPGLSGTSRRTPFARAGRIPRVRSRTLTTIEQPDLRRTPMTSKSAPSARGTKYRLLLRRRHGRGRRQPEEPPRRQGRQPGRDGRDRPARPPGLHDLDRGLHLLLRQRPDLSQGPRGGGRRRTSTSVEKAVGQKFGDPKNPLLVSVRSGARASMPGMMDTILNLGLNDKTVEGLVARPGQRALRLRLLPPLRPDVRRRRPRPQAGRQGRARPVRGDHRGEEARRAASSSTPTSPPRTSRTSSREFKAAIKEKTGHDFPEDPMEQLWGAIGAVFGSWMNDRAIAYRKLYDIPESWGTAVNVQSMVFGNMGEDSGTGVAFTRDAATGENVFYGEYLMNAQGEDVVAGIRTPLPIADARRRTMPKVYAQLEEHPPDAREALPRHDGHRVHHPAGQALHAPEPGRQADRLRRDQDRRRHGRREAHHGGGGPRSASSPTSSTSSCGRSSTRPRRTRPSRAAGSWPRASTPAPAPPPAASSSTPRTPRSGPSAARRSSWSAIETSPEDIKGMNAAEGILTARGGMTSHAALVARQMGKVCVAGCERARDRLRRSARMTVKGARRRVKEGDWISIDGSTGEVIEGKHRDEALRGPPGPHREDARPGGRARSTRSSPRSWRWADKFRTPARSAPTPTSPTRRPTPWPSAPRASASAAPSTCSSARDRIGRCAR